MLIINPVSFAFLTSFVLLLLLMLAALLLWGEYGRKETVAGYLVPDKGVVKLYAPYVGQVLDRRVEEGQHVRADDVLFVISSQRSSTGVGNIDAEVLEQTRKQREFIVAELDQLGRRAEREKQALQDEASARRQELQQLDSELAVQRERLALSRKNLETLYTLVEAGSLARHQYQLEKGKHLELEALVEGLERLHLAHRREIESIESRVDLVALEFKQQHAIYQQKLSDVDRNLAELEGRTSFAIRSPVDGVATSVAAERGQSVNPEVPLLAVLPEGARLEAHLFVPSRAIGFVKPGQSVQIRLQAFPYQRFGMQPARIARVSNTVLNPNETHAPVSLREPVYTAVALLDRGYINAYGKQYPMKPGMLLEASIEVDRHNLLRWILDPLFAVTGKL